MSSDTILKAPDGARYSMDNLASQRWLEGHKSGAQMVEGWLRTEAATKFTAGSDRDAMQLRQLADHVRDKIIPEMEQRAEQHEKDHPYELPRSKPRGKP